MTKEKNKKEQKQKQVSSPSCDAASKSLIWEPFVGVLFDRMNDKGKEAKERARKRKEKQVFIAPYVVIVFERSSCHSNCVCETFLVRCNVSQRLVSLVKFGRILVHEREHTSVSFTADWIGYHGDLRKREQA